MSICDWFIHDSRGNSLVDCNERIPGILHNLESNLSYKLSFHHLETKWQAFNVSHVRPILKMCFAYIMKIKIKRLILSLFCDQIAGEESNALPKVVSSSGFNISFVTNPFLRTFYLFLRMDT